MKSLVSLLLCLGLSLSFSLIASAAVEDPAHAELRVLRTEVIDAITKGDIETVISHVSPNVVITWQNSEVCRGIPALRDFFDRMGKTTFRGYKVPPTPDDLTILYGGNTGISYGRVVGEYDLLGKKMEFNSRWTATLVKENGRWLLASYHVSLNALDNPLINSAKNYLIGASVATGVLGLLIGWLVGRRRATRLAR